MTYLSRPEAEELGDKAEPFFDLGDCTVDLRVSWQYLAGFFDGEGHVHFSIRGGLQWSLFQAGDNGRRLLRTIKYFLALHDIESSIYTRPRRRCGETMIGHDLYVTSREMVLPLLQYLMPYLHMKKLACQDAIRYCKVFPKISSGPLLGMRIREGRHAGGSL